MKSILLANRSGINLQIIVVDNGSDDGSYERLKKIKLDGVSYEIIETGKNLGYAGGNNVGIRHAINHGADFILVVNNDVTVDMDIFSNFIKASRRFGRFGALSPKIYFAKGFEYHRDRYSDSQRGKVIWYAGGEIDWENVYGLNIGADEVDEGQYDKQTKIDFATGACVFFKTSALRKIGLFDEKYFMYSEEVDFAFRAQFLGYKSIFCPQALVFHKHKATAKKLPQYLEYWQFRNMTQTIIKDFPASILFKKWRWLKIILIHLNTIFYQLRNGFFWPPFLADLWILFQLPRLLQERSKIQKSRKVSDEYIESFLKEKKITFWGILKI